MVNVTIDRKQIQVAEGTTILEAARQNGITIPTLCYLKEINEIGACRICVVELEGNDRLVTSCNNVVKEGMVIYTNSPKVRQTRKNTVELLLSEHDCKCAICVRNGNCKLQDIAGECNIIKVSFPQHLEKNNWNYDFPLIRDASKCVKCMRCIQVCDKIQGLNIWDVEGTGARTTVQVSGKQCIEESDCTLCGQCITHCPVGALRERDDTKRVWQAIDHPKKVVVAQIAPAVRAAWGEALQLSREAGVGKLVDALRRMGVDYVFDTTFSADLTIMEEGTEFLKRFTSGEFKEHPMLTSCCPGWIRFVKSQFPHLTRYLSTAKSPQQMFGAVMKTYFAKHIGVNPEDMVTVSIMPCVSKKDEAKMELYYEEYAGHDVDIVLTTREVVRMVRSAHIDIHDLEDVPCDRLMQEGSGAGVIFGTTGGVMEAALRSAYYLKTGKNPNPDAFASVRSEQAVEGVTEATFDLDGVTLSVAAVSGLVNTRKLLERIQRKEVRYDFVEVMACPGGCVGGGGQIIHDDEEWYQERGERLYFLDQHASIRFSHENKDVAALYEQFLGEPNGHKAHMLLHRGY